MMGILSLMLLVALTLSATSAAENNTTDEIISMENDPDSESVSLEQASDDSNESKEPDVLAKSSEDVLSSTVTAPILSSSLKAPEKLTATKSTPAKVKTTKKSIYNVFKGKSKYKWKIKKTTWNKMKKQAIKEYKFFKKHGSSHPGYSKSVKVTLIKGGHKYRGVAFAVKNYRGIRCEVRGLPNGVRASTWGDY